MSSEEVECVGCQLSALIPTQSPRRDSGTSKTGPESVMNDSKLVDQVLKVEFEFEDSFDCLNDVCGVAPLEPTKLSIYNKSPVLGSDMKKK
ncbi:hypothetical protein L873DRAFT_1818812 [Choiromyces venosus 120613-1]|uniref:Uncharacterized protein n=1 Tax=Choiromyces venosus 120613-1 TaxID=1336337 RepID=A0A3N4JD99_9PEZI|nr:hypothetical protein L873DRAFT_1818812 [Choiromyces venosus 120613-1]